MENEKDDIVITGMSGRFPECESVAEFRDKLFAGIDMITEDDRRWPCGVFGIPTRKGCLKDLAHFDADYFGVHTEQAAEMDPQIRTLLEVTHEALIDAGVNPSEVRSTNTGVFVAATESTFVGIRSPNIEKISKYQSLGGNLTMFSNRISYAFDWKGPSFTLSTGCSSGLYAFDQAYKAIKNGECDAAIVGCSNILGDPSFSLQLHRLTMLSTEGACKTFDQSANGFVRSEGIVVIYLQKASIARRVYATVLGSKTNCDGYKEEGITYPSSSMQCKLIKEVYIENRINPLEVKYLEVHGTGTPLGDRQETTAIIEAFFQNDRQSLLVGSVKSNMGHAELAAGLCGLVKVLISMESSLIPANLHFKTPNNTISALIDGRLEVVAKNKPFTQGYMAISSFGFGGANGHLVLKPNPNTKTQVTRSKIPGIVCVSGCTEEGVKYLLDNIIRHKEDEEFLALVSRIHSSNIKGHRYRGYVLLGDEPVYRVSELEDDKRPVWFFYSGMGSQWAGVAKDLMKFDVIRDSIKRCSEALRPYGIDLEDVLLREDPKIFDEMHNCFIAIAAVQVVLTDLLHSVGIVPDGIIGHSAGEVGCAYGDGGLTAEQTVLTSYLRSSAVTSSNLERGLMAAVGLSREEIEPKLPDGIYIACNNSNSNITITGPTTAIENFVSQLKSEGIFAKVIPTGGYAYHSRYISGAAANHQKMIDKIIPNPKPRTSKWISTSIPQSKWDGSLAQNCSADYFVNNMMSPVYFREAMTCIPDNAIIIEVAPAGLMQALMKKMTSSATINICMVKKDYKRNSEFLLSSLGELYIAGLQPQIEHLYRPVKFPVGKGTTMISPMIKWDHSVEWPVPKFSLDHSKPKFKTKGRTLEKPRQTECCTKVKKYKFVAFENDSFLTKSGQKCEEYILRVFMQIVIENNPGVLKLKIVDLQDYNLKESRPGKFFEEVAGKYKNYLYIFQQLLQINSRTATEIEVINLNSTEVNVESSVQKHMNGINIDSTAYFILISDQHLESQPNLFVSISKLLKPGGFILLEQDIQNNMNIAKFYDNLELVSIQTSDKKIFNLLKKPLESTNNLLVELKDNNSSWIKSLKTTIEDSKSKGSKIYAYAENQSMIAPNGLVNYYKDKSVSENLRTFLIRDKTALPFSIKNYSDQIRKDLVHNVMKNYNWGNYYYLPFDESDIKLGTEHAYIGVHNKGNIQSVDWLEGKVPVLNKQEQHSHKISCSVYYASLNTNDIRAASGQEPDSSIDFCNPSLGYEFSGRDNRGKRIMGMKNGDCLATTLLIEPELIWDVPEEWSLEGAATVPLAYAMGYYAVIMRGKMQPRESILIHSGTEDVSLASIAIALHMQCDVFTTVNSNEEREFIKERFPELNDEDIGTLHDTNFEQLVFTHTKRRGVDLILNPASSEVLESSIRCLGECGRFLQINQGKISSESCLEMNIFQKRNISFHNISIDNPTYWRYQHKEVINLMKQGISNGVVKPLPGTIFDEHQVAEAFLFQNSTDLTRNIGKAVIRIRDEECEAVCIPKPKMIKSIRQTYLNPEKIYIIIGGGTLVLRLVSWLTSKGARNILCVLKNGTEKEFGNKLQKMNVKVIISTINISSKEGAYDLLKEASKITAIGGIFNLEPLLDNYITSQSQHDQKLTYRKIIDGINNLDTESRVLAPQIDYFVTFCSTISDYLNLDKIYNELTNAASIHVSEDRHLFYLPSLTIKYNLLNIDKKQIIQQISSTFSSLDFLLQQKNPISTLTITGREYKENQDVNRKQEEVFIESIISILGIKDINSTIHTKTFVDIGMDSIMGSEIKQVLDQNGIKLSTKQIRELNIKRLIEIGKEIGVDNDIKILTNGNVKETTSNKTSLIQFEMNTSLESYDTLIKMSNKSLNDNEKMFLIHPVEGTLTALEKFAIEIEADVYGLQCSTSVPRDSVKRMAEYYLTHIRTVKPKGPYILAGYSFGSCVTFEMGLILERSGEEVELVLIDGAPTYIKNYVHTLKKQIAQTANIDNVDAEIAILMYLARCFLRVDKEQMVSEISKLKSSEERVAKIVRTLSGKTPYEDNVLSVAIRTISRNLLIGEEYIPSGKFTGKVTLLKCTERFADQREDYNLSEICVQKINLFTIDGTHRSILEKPASVKKISNIINDILKRTPSYITNNK